MTFAHPDMNLKKTFELHLRKNVPRLVRRCQGNCRKRITEDYFLVVKFVWNKQMDRLKREQNIQIWTDVPSL